MQETSQLSALVLATGQETEADLRELSGEAGQTRKEAAVSMMARHKHKYITVRTVTKVVDGKTVTYYFMECVNPGCPKPNKMEVK